MLHEPATPAAKNPAGPYKMRLEIWMFVFYALFYAGFVAINLIDPAGMGEIVIAGLNLATVYGFALIVVALIEALIYDWLCRKKKHLILMMGRWKTKKQNKDSMKEKVNPWLSSSLSSLY